MFFHIYNEDSVELKFTQFDFTVNLRSEGENTVILISWKFNTIGDQKAYGLESIGGNKGRNSLLTFIDEHINENEKTAESKAKMVSVQNSIQSSKKSFQGIIINAAGYTHTSVSILDALIAVKIPTIELHISNIYAREDFRHKSLISKAAKGIICGFGTDGYLMAIDAMIKILKNENW